jgi:hypothetical protein
MLKRTTREQPAKKTDPGEIYACLPSRTRERPRLPGEDFALNLSAKRRLCNMVEGHVIEGAARCCAVSRAQSRAAATTNLARSNQSWVLRVLFGGAKSSALVNIFMIAPRWSAGDRPTTSKSCTLIAAVSWHPRNRSAT